MYIIKAETIAETRGAVNTALSIRRFDEGADIILFTNDLDKIKSDVFTEVARLKNYKPVGIEIKAGYLLLKKWSIKAKGEKTIIGDGYIIHNGEEETKSKAQSTFYGMTTYSNYREITKKFDLFTIVAGSLPPSISYYDALIKNVYKGGYRAMYI